MSEQDRMAFYKWLVREKLSGYDIEARMLKSWQAATAEANKRIAELESEVEHWKALANRPVTDNTQLIANMEHEIAELESRWMMARADRDHAINRWGELSKTNIELQASNNRIREVLEIYAGKSEFSGAAKEALSATPAESLQAHDDKLIEKAVSICQRKSDDYTSLAISCDEIKDHVGHDICIHKQAVASSIGNAIRALKQEVK